MVNKKPIKISSQEQAFHKMNDVIMKISKMYVHQHNIMQDFGVKSKLCRAEIHTIQSIGNHEGINISELATLFEVSKPTISERIKKLIKLKLVNKQLKDGNNKEVMLTLTDEGWLAYQNHERQHKKIYKLFKKHFGNKSDAFLESFGEELNSFDGFLNEIKNQTIHFQ